MSEGDENERRIRKLARLFVEHRKNIDQLRVEWAQIRSRVERLDRIDTSPLARLSSLEGRIAAIEHWRETCRVVNEVLQGTAPDRDKP